VIHRAWISFALALATAASASGCVLVDGAADGRRCGGVDGPVTVYSVAPPMTAAWWVVVPIAGDVSAPGYVPSTSEETTEAPLVSEPTDEVPEGTDPTQEEQEEVPGGTDTPPEPESDPSGGDGSVTMALRPLDYVAGGCFSCSIVCRTGQPGPGQPHAFSTASGVSATSQAAACADAERRLERYASQSYSLDLVACGVIPE
jgi:hypothetical protein